MPLRLLLDMDGVLVDVSGSYRRAVIETAQALGAGAVTRETVQAYKDRGGYNNDWVLTQALVRDAGRDVAFETVVEAFQERYRGADWDGYIAEEPPLVRTETLERLSAEGELALVTGRPEADARWTLERFGWSRFFPVVVAMEQQGGREKPDPFPLELALRLLAERAGQPLEPRQAVYAGDTVDDVRAARAAGLRAVGVVPPYLDAETHRETLAAAGAEAVAGDVNDLPTVLARL
ncbi:MAG: TIGR01548 family HAD-type hydrolase [Rhodothermales bacterium]|nr:TIGR01548 family HAD-type hydrolase [Rhodothermales bacterium]